MGIERRVKRRWREKLAKRGEILERVDSRGKRVEYRVGKESGRKILGVMIKGRFPKGGQ